MIFNDNTVDTAAQAVQALLSQQLSTVGYDKTLVYTITDDKTKDKGSYTVSDGSVSFTAYTEDTSYKKDDKVYVTIPQGDFTQKKIIIGRYIDSLDEEQGVGYISPEDRIVPIYSYDLDLTNIEFGIVASGNSENKILIPDSTNIIDIINNNSKTYVESDMTRLVLNVELESHLSDYNIVSGQYGVGLILISTNNQINEENKYEHAQENRVEISSEKMIGNIYNYSGALQQSAIFDISQLGNIVGIRPYIYQENNFKSQGLNGLNDLKDIYGEKIPKDPNILVKSIKIEFGYGQEEFNQKDNLILTLNRIDNNFYDSKNEAKKNMLLKYIKLNEENKKYEYARLKQSGEILELYENSYTVQDNRAGIGWKKNKELTDIIDSFDFNFSSNEPKKTIKVLKVIPNEEEEQIISSNIFEFNNSDFSQNTSGLIWLQCEEGTEFANYGQDYRIENLEDSKSVKTITATLASTREFTNVSITWVIPTYATMFQSPIDNYLYTQYQKPETSYKNNEINGQYIITTKYSFEELKSGKKIQLGFGIRDIYVPSFTNNNITCYAIYDEDDSYRDEGNIAFNFGQYETAGTDFQFALFYEDPSKTCLYPDLGVGDSIKIYPYLTNKSDPDKAQGYLSSVSYEWKGSQQISSQGGWLIRNPYLDNGVQKCEVLINKVTTNGMLDMVSDILIASVEIGKLKLQYELPISLGYIQSTDTQESKTIGVQAPTILSYTSLGDPMNNSSSTSLKVLGKNKNLVPQEAQNLNSKTANQVLYKWGVPTGEFTQLTHGGEAINRINNSRLFTLTLTQPLGLTEGKNFFIHRHTSWVQSYNWYELYPIKKINDTTWLVYFIQNFGVDSKEELFFGETFQTIGNFSAYLTHTETNSGGTVIKSLVQYNKDLPLITYSTKLVSKILFNERQMASDIYFKVPSGRKATTDGEEIKTSGDQLDNNIEYWITIWKDEEGALIEEAGDKIYSLPVYTLQNISTSDKVLTLSYAKDKGDLTLNPKEIESLEKMLEATNFSGAYVYLQIENLETKIKSSLVDIKNQTIKFDLSQDLQNKNITIYLEKITYTEYDPGIGNADYPNLKWRLMIYGAPSTSGEGSYKLGKYEIDLFSPQQQMGLPLIKINKNENGEILDYFLQPYPFYQSSNYIPCLEAYNEEIIDGVKVITVYWIQPILIKQYLYGYPLLNEWDGEATTINESSIMSPCIGAGSKNDDNTFNGVLMGKIKDETKEKEPAKHGLYGFNKGQEVFGFKEDGTAFIGKSSGGRILFDGNKSEIKSASYDPTTDEDGNEIPGTGILLDLDNPIFDLKKNGKSLIKFNPNNSDSNGNEMYLQTEVYDEENHIGTRFDLINGYLRMNGSKPIEGKENPYTISISSNPEDTPILIEGDTYKYKEWVKDEEGNEVVETKTARKQFKVDWGGSLSATGADIKGDITAGTVGGWNISTDNSGNGWLGYTAPMKSDSQLQSTGIFFGGWIKQQLDESQAMVKLNKFNNLISDGDKTLESGDIIPSNKQLLSFKITGLKKLTSYAGNNYLYQGFKPKLENETTVTVEIDNIIMQVARQENGGSLGETLGKAKYSATLSPSSGIANDTALINMFNSIRADYELAKSKLDQAKDKLTNVLLEIFGGSFKDDIEEKLGAITEKRLKDDVYGGMIASLYVERLPGLSAEKNPWHEIWQDTTKYRWIISSSQVGTEKPTINYPPFYACDPTFFIEIMFSDLFSKRDEKIEFLDNAISGIWNDLVSSTEVFSLSTQGNLKTKGCIISGGMKSGDGVWAINPRATTWKMKYGYNYLSSDFFGVAMPFESGEWNRGIRFNNNRKSTLLNGSGIRFYDWGYKEDYSGNSVGTWFLKGGLEFDNSRNLKISSDNNLKISSNNNLKISSNNFAFSDGVFSFSRGGYKHSIYGDSTSFYLTHKKDTDDYSYLAFNSKDGIYLKKDKNTPYIRLDLKERAIFMYNYVDGKQKTYKVALTEVK